MTTTTKMNATTEGIGPTDDLPEDSNIAVGRRVAALRNYLGLSQAAMGERLGTVGPRVGNWEIGTARPDVNAAIKIATWTGVTLDWIYRGDTRLMPMELLRRLEAVRHMSRPPMKRVERRAQKSQKLKAAKG